MQYHLDYLDSNNSIQSILGLNISEIVNKLQQLVHEKFPAFKTEQENIDSILQESNDNNILFGIPIKSDGKVLSPKETQALMLKNVEYKQTIYSQNKTIKSLKVKIVSKKDDDIIILNNAKIQELVETKIEEKKLGLTIFMSTSQYLSILFSLPYPNCLDIKTSTQYTNEDPGIKYSRLVAGATLTGGINRNSFQTALVIIEVTNQCYK
ncbi:11952_t:CDS:2 [Funneliformis geosporum]|nr:11952_t:CDS:2 [Funneliformis geosporum]